MFQSGTHFSAELTETMWIKCLVQAHNILIQSWFEPSNALSKNRHLTYMTDIYIYIYTHNYWRHLLNKKYSSKHHNSSIRPTHLHTNVYMVDTSMHVNTNFKCPRNTNRKPHLSTINESYLSSSVSHKAGLKPVSSRQAKWQIGILIMYWTHSACVKIEHICIFL